MKKMDTSHIEDWPEGVVLGAAEIKKRGEVGILSKTELEEYNGFTNPSRKAEFLSVRYLFYSLLDEMGFPQKETKLLKLEHGKPYAKIGDKVIQVSFSHSPEKVFCAISSRMNIGLDVEHLQRKINEAVVKRILKEDEYQQMGKESPLKLWTIKEAAVKCLGTGLRTNLKDLTIFKNGKNRFSVRFNDDISFGICSFQQSDHQIALAYQI